MQKQLLFLCKEKTMLSRFESIVLIFCFERAKALPIFTVPFSKPRRWEWGKAYGGLRRDSAR